MKKLLSSLGLVLLPLVAFLQTNTIDSLLNVAKTAAEETLRYEAYMELGDHYKYDDVDSAIYYYDHARNTAIKIGGTDGDIKTVEALNDIGWCLYLVSEYDEAKEYYNRGLAIVNKYENNSDTQLEAKLNKLKRNYYSSMGAVYIDVSEPKKALELLYKALTYCDKEKDKGGVSVIYNNIGIASDDLSDYPKALEYYFNALKIDQELEDEIGQGYLYNNIGVVYKDLAQYHLALDYLFKGLKIREKTNNKSGQISALGNIGLVYMEMDNLEKAIQYYTQAIEISESYGDKSGHAINLGNLAIVYNRLSDTKKALEMYEKALAITVEIGYTQGQARNLGNIGTLYFDLKNYDEALRFFNQALVLNEETGERRSKGINLGNIGNVYLIQKKYDLAEKYLKDAVLLNKENGAIYYLESNYKSLSELSFNRGKYKEALMYFKEHVFYRDSLNNEANIKASVRQEMVYEFEKRTTADSIAFAKESEIRDAEIARQNAELMVKRNQQYGLFGGLALLLVFSGFIYNRFTVTRKQKNIIEVQKAEVENQREIAEEKKTEAVQQRKLVEEKNREILDSIHYAKRLQEAILPPLKLVKEYFEDSFIIYMPKDIVSGDFYWMINKEEFILFAVADCTGHGVPGAMISVVCANALNKSVNELGLVDPGQILDSTRDLVLETFMNTNNQINDGMDISLCCLNKLTGELHWAGANNPLWVIRNDGAEIEEIKGDKQPIGNFYSTKSFTTHKVFMQKGDSIYLFSDGYADQFGGEKIVNSDALGKKLKVKNFKRILLESSKLSMSDQKSYLMDSFNNWKGSIDQIDDVCIIGVRCQNSALTEFSPREIEIIRNLAQGLSSKMIADKLNISVHTVDTHRRKILKKINVNSTTELLHYLNLQGSAF